MRELHGYITTPLLEGFGTRSGSTLGCQQFLSIYSVLSPRPIQWNRENNRGRLVRTPSVVTTLALLLQDLLKSRSVSLAAPGIISLIASPNG